MEKTIQLGHSEDVQLLLQFFLFLLKKIYGQDLLEIKSRKNALQYSSKAVLQSVPLQAFSSNLKITFNFQNQRTRYLQSA